MARYAKWYVVAWRLLWAVPYAVTLVLFAFVVLCGWGWRDCKALLQSEGVL